MKDWLSDVSRARGAALLGVLNVTPDSFSDGGLHYAADDARAHVDRLLDEGVDVIDIGAESTRPGAPAIAAHEQWERAGPAIRHAVGRGARVSIDTTSLEVAERALDAGVVVVNDVSCLGDVELARVTARFDAHLLLMHSRGSMTTMGGFSTYDENGYDDVVVDVAREWSAARERAVEAGLARERIWFDPGLGFHKNAEQSFELLRRFGEFERLGAVLTLGPSRKSFISQLDGSAPHERLGGTIAACLHAVDHGARLLRVHDVRAVRQALDLRRALAPQGISTSQSMSAPRVTSAPQGTSTSQSTSERHSNPERLSALAGDASRSGDST